jgi:hypothetical protein
MTAAITGAQRSPGENTDLLDPHCVQGIERPAK